MSACPAFRRDDTLALAPGVPRRIGAAIASRVAAWPHGLVRTYGIDGVQRSVTYEAAWSRSGRIAVALERCAHATTEPVVLVVDDVVDMLPAFWACLRAGRTVIALQGAVEAADRPLGLIALRNVLSKLGNPLLLVDEFFASSVVIGMLAEAYRVLPLSAANDVDVPFDDAAERPSPVCLVSTSGSTGTIKLARLDEPALLHRYFSTDRPGPRAGANSLGVFPSDSMSGLRMGFLVCDTFTQIDKRTLTTRPEVILDAVRELRISGLSLTNSLARRLLDAERTITRPLDLGSLRSCALGGEAIVREIAVDLDAMLARHGAPGVLYAGYGATEIGDIVAAANPLAGEPCPQNGVRLGACAPGVAMRIVGEEGAVLAEGEVGEVEVAAPLKIFSGYWGEAELTRSCFTPDGWWKTGDRGQLDDGIFTFRGRSKQILVINGRKISLTEIDAHLEAHAEIGVQTASVALRIAGEATEHLGIAFVADGIDAARTTEAIRSETLRAFGIRPDPVLPLSRAALPLTSTGKVRSAELAALLVAERERAAARGRASGAEATSIEIIGPELEAIWREVLNLPADFDRTKTFFDLRGDSLRSAALYASVEARLGRRLRMDAFFEDPTYRRFVELVTSPTALANDRAVMAETGSIWPLPDGFRDRQLAILETWPGERVTPDRLLLGMNVDGRLPPLFCVLNMADELEGLAASLGPEQPVYTFRSCYQVSDYAEDKIQAIALSYIHDLERVCPAGPLFLLGQCQGAILAIAMAQHLMRRERHVPLLVLAEWTTQSVHYPGPTLLVFGHDSTQHPRHEHRDSRRAWHRLVPDHSVIEVPGLYGKLYREDNVPILAAELSTRFARALAQAPRIVPHAACRVELQVEDAPKRLTAGQHAALDVALRNVGDIVVSTRRSGLMLGNYWTHEDTTRGNRVDGRGWIPDLAVDGTTLLRLDIRAPAQPGRYRLCIDVVEEGCRWMNPINQGGFAIEVEVEPAPAQEPVMPLPAITAQAPLRRFPMRLLQSVLRLSL